MTHDFWRFWAGQTVSAFGSSFTQFAIPLLVFKLTGSPLYLAATFALYAVPHLLFGLIIGAWTDRTDRRRLMMTVDLLSALAIGSVPIAAALGVLTVWWVMVVIFVSGALSIFFEAAQFGAVPSLVEAADLVTANGRIQASFAAATVAGPLVAGGLLLVLRHSWSLRWRSRSSAGPSIHRSHVRAPASVPTSWRVFATCSVIRCCGTSPR